MRRLAATTIALAALTPASAAAQGTAGQPPLRARLVACQTGPGPADRFAVFTGSMPAIPGSERLAMRFDLQQRTRGAATFARVTLPKWGVWEHTAQLGVPGFIFTKRVERLAAPAAYRAVLRFRWYGPHGKLLRTARRVSPACVQPDPRPDLVPGALTAEPAGGDTARYTLVVANRGLAAAGPFSVAIGDTTVDLDGLAAGGLRQVSAVGPRCAAGGPVRVVVDSAGAVEEAREGNNAAERPCPLGRR